MPPRARRGLPDGWFYRRKIEGFRFGDGSGLRLVSKEAFEKERAAMLAGSQAMRTNAVAVRKAVFGDPRTLYGRGGGVFGLARLVDKLMDAWMEDPTLNGNAKVARWHETEQRCGL